MFRAVSFGTLTAFLVVAASMLGCTNVDDTDAEGAFESLTASASPSPAPPAPPTSPPDQCGSTGGVTTQGAGTGKTCRSCYAACMAKGQLSSEQCYAICYAMVRGGCHAAGDICIAMPYPANDYCATVLTPFCGVTL